VAAALFSGIRALVTPSVATLLFQRHRYLRLGFANARRSELRALVRPALANVAIPLAHALNIQGMVLVVGAVLGPVAVVVFSTLRTLTRLVLQLVLSVSHAVEPELARAWGTGDQSLMRRMYVHSMSAAFWMAFVAAVGLHFLGGAIITLWTRGKVVMDATLFDWLLVSAVASVLWYSGLNLLKAANLHLGGAVCYVLASLAAVVAATLFLQETGRLADAGLALLVMDAIMAPYLLYKASGLVGVSAPSLLAQVADPRLCIRGLQRMVSSVK
jgi:O-antigen/teichoic acid export membrane protein